MLNSENLRALLKEVFGVEDRYLVPLNGSWFAPTINPEDDIGTWIGYKILSKTPYTRAYQTDHTMVKPIKVKFRLSFVGPQAEALADKVMMWEDRTDVTLAFEKLVAQINYEDRSLFTYPIQYSGFNDRLCWVIDLSAQTVYEVDTKQELWIKKTQPDGGLNGK